MISCFLLDDQGLQRRVVTAQDTLPEAALWIDLLEPAPDEEAQVEQFLAVDVPTREEMREIESSNRLYEENGSLYMTATVVTKLDTERPESSQITFILTPNRLITNRYVDLLPFRRYIAYAERSPMFSSVLAVISTPCRRTCSHLRLAANDDGIPVTID